MTRVMAAAVLAAAFFVALHRPASAMVELCPAQMEYRPVGGQTAPVRAASLFGFELNALGPRTVTSAMLAFDTDNGWYTVDVPAVTLFQKNHHYANSLSSFTRHDWVSPVLYVTFPADVTIVRTWVYSAAARNADTFGWDALGAVACPPPPDLAPDQRALYKGQQVRVMRDKAYQLENPDPLSAPPTSRSLILKAMPSKPLEHTNCAEPFREGEVRDQASPIYPAMLDGSAIGGMTSVEVAINPDGTLHDAWVWGPSGSSSLDNSALRAARQSTFKGARSYCMPVPSTYFFDVMFDPH